MNFHKKIVALVTLFFAGTSGVFLLTGAGAPGLRLLICLIFFVSALNLSVYWREFGRWLGGAARAARGHLADAGKAKETEGEITSEAAPPKTKEMKRAKPDGKPKPRAANHYEKEEPDSGFDDDFDDEEFEFDDSDDDFEFEDEDKDER